MLVDINSLMSMKLVHYSSDSELLVIQDHSTASVRLPDTLHIVAPYNLQAAYPCTKYSGAINT